MSLRRLFLTALVVVLALVADQAGYLKGPNDRLAEWRMELAPRAPTGSIVLLDIDSKSIAAVGTWPWPRSIYAETIDRLRALNASEIALDIDLSSASTPEQDALLEAALARADGSVILVAFSQYGMSGAGVRLLETKPIARFADHAWVANVNVAQDADGFVRALRFGSAENDTSVPTLPAMLSGAAGSADERYLVDFGIRGDLIDRISLIDLINGIVDRARIDGKKVIVGAQAVELHDFFNVPVHGVISGTLLQAVAAETLMQGRALQAQPEHVGFLGLLLIFLFGALVVPKIGWTKALAIIATVALGVEAVAYGIQTLSPIVPQTAAWLFGLALLAILVFVHEIDFQKILVLIWRTETSNAQVILEGVVRDNFAGVLVANDSGRIISASRAARSLLHLDEDPAGRPLDTVPIKQFGDELRAAIELLRSDKWFEQGPREVVHELAGEQRIFEYVVTPSRLEGPLHRDGQRQPDEYVACLTFSDTTAKRRDQARIEYLARFDPLTGLANRNWFIERAGAVLVDTPASSACAIVIFGLDRFQIINDTLGHNIGDQLIRAMAVRARTVDHSDALLARIGGDEFAILYCGHGAEERARGFAEALIGRVHEPFLIEAHHVIVGVSAGLAVANSRDDSALGLLAQADTALNRAKAVGGNKVLSFEAAMIEGLSERQSLEGDLWTALKRNEFQLVYQPQYDLHDRRMTGVEALLRWHHPERGLVPPNEFISLAEATGLIGPLGEWILEKACLDAACWSGEVRLAVNVSPVQFARGNPVEAVARALAKSGFPAGRLDVEITESLFLQKTSSLEAKLETLSRMGVGLVLDDFGTGYSSMGYLRRYHVDKIKIDRSFVTGLPLQADSVAIVQAVCALGTSLGIRTNAEGIETEAQFELLRLAGCQEGQGYLLGRPQAASGISALLAAEPQRKAS